MLSIGKADEKLWEGESLGLYDLKLNLWNAIKDLKFNYQNSMIDLKFNLWYLMINLKLADDQSILLPNPVF